MLTKLTIRNFKLFEEIEIELGQNVVFIGPNNSGKTTALQALALWYTGLQKRQGVEFPITFPITFGATASGSITINRFDLSAIPVSDTHLLWRNLHVQNNGIANIRIIVDGITDTTETWTCGLEFEFVNEESFNCRLLNLEKQPLEKAVASQVTFLPPMSGLALIEDRLERGSIQRRIGEGRTAEVLRNLCYQLYETNGQAGHWDKLVGHIRELFEVELLPPDYLPARGEIRMAYRERSGILLDLSSSGRGMLQVMLLLAYLYANPGAVLLLDEPDAHLEIIRQREIYHLLTTVAQEQGSQIIAASHSEIILEEAAGLDTTVAFVGKPHRIDKRNKSQVAKALKEIRATDYYLAERTGWVLYLEGSTDLAILRAFANQLRHPVSGLLEQAFVHYLDTNKPSKAVDHFQGLREAKPDLVGIALFDRVARGKLQKSEALVQLAWQRREIENYLLLPDALTAYARENQGEPGDQAMQESISLLAPPIALQNRHDKWWMDVKASDDFLDRLFELYFEHLNLPNLMRKTNYHVLARFVPAHQLHPEVAEKLDAISNIAGKANPRVS